MIENQKKKENYLDYFEVTFLWDISERNFLSIIRTEISHWNREVVFRKIML